MKNRHICTIAHPLQQKLPELAQVSMPPIQRGFRYYLRSENHESVYRCMLLTIFQSYNQQTIEVRARSFLREAFNVAARSSGAKS